MADAVAAQYSHQRISQILARRGSGCGLKPIGPRTVDMADYGLSAGEEDTLWKTRDDSRPGKRRRFITLVRIRVEFGAAGAITGKEEMDGSAQIRVVG